MGIKIGIEIHQRLNTGKLFCDCPHCYNKERKSDEKIGRELHLSLSELGKVDIAAKKEHEKGKEIEYNYFDDSCCLVDADEEPPHRMNQRALAYALGIAMQFNMKIIDKPNVMRKIVIDGSNTSGFQRTCLVALDGFVETSEGKVGIDTLCIEEESAGIVGEENGKKVFSLDRLGIPLIEIATAPDIVDAEHCVETAEKMGLAMRIAGVAERGIGTIRQDLNVSIPEGERVEIKGAQELFMIPKWIGNEIERQRKLVEISKELGKRNAYSLLKKSNPTDITGIIKMNAVSGFVKSAVEKGESAIAILMPNHKGLLGMEINPERRYGSEISDYAKHAGVKGIIHSDEKLEKYGFGEHCVRQIRERLNAGDGDSFVIVVAPRETALKAISFAKQRALVNTIPKETRQALPSGASSYMRPIATSARMYPETDIPIIEYDKSIIKLAKQIERKTYGKMLAWLEGILNKDLAGKMIRSRQLPLFEDLVEKKIDPSVAAITLEDTWIRLSREKIEIDEDVVVEALMLFNKGKITKKAIYDYIKRVCSKEEKKKVLESLKIISGKELEKLAKEYGNDNSKLMRDFGNRINMEELSLGKK
ncbi:MAG: Glu-tRNA(Gln) amidotransferase subunit GatE [Candidatus Micrarchaeota archaeon]|nr:Glu-tRNA(Gln) amidotransferase subunit GatE [Candidatus Micrarchaeota archaeon]